VGAFGSPPLTATARVELDSSARAAEQDRDHCDAAVSVAALELSRCDALSVGGVVMVAARV
jgi:hypothetical protein